MNTPRDNNHVATILGISNSDGSTLLSLKANPTNHRLMNDDGFDGLDLTGDNALRDENFVTSLLAVSEVDGVTPVPIYIDSITGRLLIKST